MSQYKHYEFKCTDCEKEFKAGMWVNRDGEPEGTKCECGSLQYPIVKDETGSRIMIGTGGGANGHDWQKKIPSGFKDFMQEFKKRHGRENTIESYKNGVSEY